MRLRFSFEADGHVSIRLRLFEKLPRRGLLSRSGGQ